MIRSRLPFRPHTQAMRPNSQSRMHSRLGKFFGVEVRSTQVADDRWGIEATRSEFYRTPLIVAMSVILALMIVAGIIL
jgi:hypothetical protein